MAVSQPIGIGLQPMEYQAHMQHCKRKLEVADAMLANLSNLEVKTDFLEIDEGNEQKGDELGGNESYCQE